MVERPRGGTSVPLGRLCFSTQICVRALLSGAGRLAKVALLCLAGSVVPTHAASMFGAVDPVNVKALTSPAANEAWTPGSSLPQVSAPDPLAAVPSAALSR